MRGGRGALNVEASEARFCERDAHLRNTAEVDLGERARDGGRWIRDIRGRGETRGITGQQCADIIIMLFVHSWVVANMVQAGVSVAVCDSVQDRVGTGSVSPGRDRRQRRASCGVSGRRDERHGAARLPTGSTALFLKERAPPVAVGLQLRKDSAEKIDWEKEWSSSVPHLIQRTHM